MIFLKFAVIIVFTILFHLYYIPFEGINQALKRSFNFMSFISASEDLVKKSFTNIENKFITKYLPVLDSNAVKVYLMSLYVYQNELIAYTQEDFAKALHFTQTQVIEYFKYLEEFELISVLSESPLEVKILDCGNVYGTPKKYKPAKYADFTKNAQNVIKGRMISTNEFMEYFYLIEEYGFEQNALIMIITYCVSLKGDDIKLPYIKKVAKSFAEDGATTAKKVDEKLSAYTSSTPALIKLFSTIGINRRPDVNDDKLYKKWTEELGFEEKSIICTAKLFKAKTVEKIDIALSELFKNRKFDVKEIEDYFKNKNSVYAATSEIARSLGVYMQNSAPFVENFVNVWVNYGFELSTLKALASYCFMNGKNSFNGMDEFVKELYEQGIVTDNGVNECIEKLNERDKLIKKILTACGLSRKIIPWDIESLKKWQNWGFAENMILEAAKLSAGKSNPTAYMSAILSAWKTQNIFDTDKIAFSETTVTLSKPVADEGTIERHYSELRSKAEEKAENAIKIATSDSIYGELYKQINSLNIKLAFAEIRNENEAKSISKEIALLEQKSNERLNILGIDKNSFTPQYSCKTCNDTGYDKSGKPCDCLKKFLKNFNS